MLRSILFFVTSLPKVFISHASEDKDRFVLEFARRLRTNGIDAWVDKWEMLPGDSLVDKIFAEGIKQAQAVIVVISKNSVTKPWVREEINAAFVKRINGASKLIPVIIDDCEIPECLKSTVWERITNLEAFEAGLARIVMAVFGQNEKPPLGISPPYVQQAILIGSLTPIDSTLFCSLCDHCVAQTIDRVDGPGLLTIFEALQLDEDQACESLEILAGRGYVELLKIGGVDVARAEPTLFGFDEYLRHTTVDYKSTHQ